MILTGKVAGLHLVPDVFFSTCTLLSCSCGLRGYPLRYLGGRKIGEESQEGQTSESNLLPLRFRTISQTWLQTEGKNSFILISTEHLNDKRKKRYQFRFRTCLHPSCGVGFCGSSGSIRRGILIGEGVYINEKQWSYFLSLINRTCQSVKSGRKIECKDP
jgi:hypothetical protein